MAYKRRTSAGEVAAQQERAALLEQLKALETRSERLVEDTGNQLDITYLLGSQAKLQRDITHQVAGMLGANQEKMAEQASDLRMLRMKLNAVITALLAVSAGVVKLLWMLFDWWLHSRAP